METIVLSSSKGGQGVTTTAVALAATIASGGTMTNIRSSSGSDDLVAVLGLAQRCLTLEENAEWLDEYAATDLHAGQKQPKGTEVDVVDAGTSLPSREFGEGDRFPRHFLVIRPCYLALRAAMRQGIDGYEGVILLDEPGRALTMKDIEDILGIPIVAVVPVDPSIARAVDAGILTRRIPEIIAKPLRKVR